MRSTVGTRLRLTIDGPELMCAHCGEWWPIDTESWRVNSLDPRRQIAQWAMCRVCYQEDQRLRKAMKYATDDQFRRRENQRTATYKRRWRSWVRRYHPDLLDAHDRAVTARSRERVRDYIRRSKENAA